jgi:hypothetical protein
MRTLALALICALAAGTATGREANECIAAAGTTAPDFGLPHVAKAIANKALDIAVIGSASSELIGPSGASIAYPVRLEAALGQMLPGVAIKVSTYAKPRFTAGEMAAKLRQILAEAKPSLVVWQTGTADAIRGIDPDEFRTKLDEGVDMLQAAGVDVVFMNMQYSPRTEAMLAVGPYADTMRITALQREVVLFDRFSIMQRWNESGVFDLYGTTRKTDVAERVHDCLGRLLAQTVVAGAKLTMPAKKATR